MPTAVRTVLFSTLYPSSVRPLLGIFVETRLRELLQTGRVQSKVVAPVAWVPKGLVRSGRPAAMASTPKREVLNGIDVLHPRYIAIPKFGMTVAPLLLALGARPALRQLQAEGFDFDVIDAHYYYPDGVAAAILGRWFSKPVAITARGTDINLIPEHRLPRLMIRWAAEQASASIGVSAALVERMRELGVRSERLHVMRNGVDLGRFRPLTQTTARREVGQQGAPLLLCVGNLHHHKGQGVAVQALARLRMRRPGARLVIVGDGPDRERLLRQAATDGVEDAVHFAGAVPNEELAQWYSAADVLLLPSSREGWPNVLLEALACGTPVVASRVGGVTEIVADSVAGRVVDDCSADGFASAVEDLLANGVDRPAVRRYAEGFGWADTSRDQVRLFSAMAGLA